MGKRWALLGWMVMPVWAHAGWVFDPYTGVDFEQNNNLFAVPTAYAVYDPRGIPRMGDFVTTARVGAETDYQFDRQRVYSIFEGRYLDYEHFTDLNHAEYLANVGMDWKLLTIFDGLLDARQSKQIVQFAERTVTTLTYVTDKMIKGTFNVAVTPDWRVETTGYSHRMDSPLQGAPDFALHETSEDLAIKYVGIANLSYGVDVQYLTGHYSGAPVALGFLDYTQTSENLTANYSVSGVTKLNAAVGYTQRTLQGTPTPLGGVTGTFGYLRQITGKTSVNLQFNRAVNSYFNAGSTEIDTSELGNVLWQATPKVSAGLTYQHMHSVFEGTAYFVADTQGRVDDINNGTLEIKYYPRRWLMIRPYVTRQVRNSTVPLFSFNDTIFGIEFLVRDSPTKR